jgi:hypothetical protein
MIARKLQDTAGIGWARFSGPLAFNLSPQQL